MRAPLKRYYLRSIVPLLLYTLLVVAGHGLADGIASPALKTALVLAPLLPFGWIFYRYFQYLAECDELERKIEMDAIAISAMAGALTGMALLFLIDHALVSPSKRELVGIGLAALCTGYFVTRYVGIWRYRA